MEAQFLIGEIVWAKLKGYPWWPGKIVEQINSDYKVLFYKENNYSILQKKNILKFEENKKRFLYKKNKNVLAAVKLAELDKTNSLQLNKECIFHVSNSSVKSENKITKNFSINKNYKKVKEKIPCSNVINIDKKKLNLNEAIFYDNGVPNKNKNSEISNKNEEDTKKIEEVEKKPEIEIKIEELEDSKSKFSKKKGTNDKKRIIKKKDDDIEHLMIEIERFFYKLFEFIDKKKYEKLENEKIQFKRILLFLANYKRKNFCEFIKKRNMSKYIQFFMWYFENKDRQEKELYMLCGKVYRNFYVQVNCEQFQNQNINADKNGNEFINI